LDVKIVKNCEVACLKKLKREEKLAFANAIDDDYRVHWIVDNLPVGMKTTLNKGMKTTVPETVFARGFPVGFKVGTGKDAKHALYNHIRMIISYHDDADFALPGTTTTATGANDNNNEASTTTKIVGFRVEPMSIKHAWSGSDPFVPGQSTLTTCSALTANTNKDMNSYQYVDKNSDSVVIFTYDVRWEESKVEWSQRWDVYLTAGATGAADKVHWFSITTSIMIVLFLTVVIAMILIRNLRKDIAQYNDPSTIEEAKEESGWKLVHGDVFRPPTLYPMLFR